MGAVKCIAREWTKVEVKTRAQIIIDVYNTESHNKNIQIWKSENGEVFYM